MDPGIDEHLAAGRHARAFDLVVPAYRDRVFRLAYSILRDRAAAEDAAQETFGRVWKALPGFDGRAALGTWIYAITRNTSLMELRRRRPTVSFDDPDSTEAQRAAESIATGPAQDPERANLLRLLETLPHNQQEAVRLLNDLELAIRELEECRAFTRCPVCGAPVETDTETGLCDDTTCLQIAKAEAEILRVADVMEDR